MKTNEKVGILGGTFDPIHLGHLILAETAYDRFNLNKVLIMPTPHPPHKMNKDITDTFHRSNMIKLVCEDNPHFQYSGFELDRKGTTFTSETLTLLKKENPNTEYYFIIGADSLFSIETWMEPEKVLSLSILLAGQRDDHNNESVDRQIIYLNDKYNCRIHKIDIPNFSVSSTMIINKIRNNESIKYYVPEKVEKYIKDNNLYKD